MAHLIQLLGKWNRIENSYHQTIVCMQVRCCICPHNFVGFLFDQQKKQYQVQVLGQLVQVAGQLAQVVE